MSAIIATRLCLTVPATELRDGDEIREHGSIPLRVDAVRVFKDHGFVVVDYSCTAGSGSRTLALTTRVYIHRLEEESH